MSDDLVAIGRVGPPRGVRGDVFVEPWTDDPDTRFAAGTALHTAPTEGGLTVESSSTAGGRLVIHFHGVDDRDAAQRLRGTRLLVPATERPPLEDPDEYYASDLIGLAVEDPAGSALGAVLDVIDIAGADYLVLEVDGRERLVPFVAALVPVVDMTAKRVVVDPPEGLFDL
jgi:16S rRNA processing protein RimM